MKRKGKSFLEKDNVIQSLYNFLDVVSDIQSENSRHAKK